MIVFIIGIDTPNKLVYFVSLTFSNINILTWLWTKESSDNSGLYNERYSTFLHVTVKHVGIVYDDYS